MLNLVTVSSENLENICRLGHQANDWEHYQLHQAHDWDHQNNIKFSI